MPVDTQHEEYDLNKKIWSKCRDVVSGQEQIHLSGEVYLPKLTGQTKKEYDAYVSRALFYNATQRTVDAMAGLLFRKDPVQANPLGIDPLLQNIDLKGNTLNVFVEDIADEVLAVGRFGLLVEHPEFVEGVISKADAESNNVRPFFVKYLAEDIINWETTTINNEKKLSRVVLREHDTVVSPVDEFETESILQYRVLDLDEGKYRQRIYQDDGTGKKQYTLVEEKYPIMDNAYMNEIPFIPISSKGNEIGCTKSPIIDLVNVNISHYRTTADLEHGAHFTGLPTPVVTGHTAEEDDDPLYIGSTKAWVFTEPDAQASFLEFNGSGLDALEKRLEKKENQMATLGARMLASEKAAAETAETHLIKRQGENSALASIAQSISDGVLKALAILAKWSGNDGEVDYRINKDFIPTKMSSQDLVAVLGAWQSGAIAYSDLVENLQRGEIVDTERTPEEIKSEIDLDGPGIIENPDDDTE